MNRKRALRICHGSIDHYVFCPPVAGPVAWRANPMWRCVAWVAALILVFLHTARLNATILHSNEIKIDFTNTNAASHASWSPEEGAGITSEGLGWDPSPDGREVTGCSILTHPIGIAFFWRPTTSARVKVEIQPGPGFRTWEGEKYWQTAGRMFIRHSPDLVHWSSWQELQSGSMSNRVFEGTIGVPEREQIVYETLRLKYQRSHMARGSNEEAAVRWIVQNDPEFFAKHLPFIGHVQLLFEGRFEAGHRFKSLDASFSYSVGGVHTEPAEPKEREEFRKQMMTVPWRFEGTRDGD